MALTDQETASLDAVTAAMQKIGADVEGLVSDVESVITAKDAIITDLETQLKAANEALGTDPATIADLGRQLAQDKQDAQNNADQVVKSLGEVADALTSADTSVSAADAKVHPATPAPTA